MAVLGIDISKSDFHACLIDENRIGRRSFPNSQTGFSQLSKWLTNRKVVTVFACMEATGFYWEALALYLFEAGHEVSVVNPSRTKAYANSEILRAKTDSIDAAMIARFAQAQRPPLWQPPAPESRVLQALVRHLEHLKTIHGQQVVRLETPGLPLQVTASIEAVIADLRREITEIERAIRDHIDRHPGLKVRHDLLTSIKGIGDTTASLILAELPALDRLRSTKAVAAYAGLSPRALQSGTSIRGRGSICRTGNSRLRKAFFYPALTAIRYNPQLKAFADRLTLAGKPRMVVVTAVMRKLLVLAYAVLKSGRQFDPSF